MRIVIAGVGAMGCLLGACLSPLADVTQLERPTFVMHRGIVARIGGQRAPFPPN